MRLTKNGWKAVSPTLAATPKPTGETQNAPAAHLVMVSGTVFSMLTEPLSLQGQRGHGGQCLPVLGSNDELRNKTRGIIRQITNVTREWFSDKASALRLEGCGFGSLAGSFPAWHSASPIGIVIVLWGLDPPMIDHCRSLPVWRFHVLPVPLFAFYVGPVINW